MMLDAGNWDENVEMYKGNIMELKISLTRFTTCVLLTLSMAAAADVGSAEGSAEGHQHQAQPIQHQAQHQHGTSDIMVSGQIQGVDDVTLSYVAARHHDRRLRPALLIVNGRTETWLKYTDIIQDFYHQGFNVYSYDHRGQGLSGRMQTDSTKGYVADFSNYTNDLNRIYQQVVSEHESGPVLVLTHSMGGAVLIRYLEQYPNPFRAAALVSPMVQPNTGLPFGPSCLVARAQRWLASIAGSESYYMPSQGPWKPKSFEGNRLTHSRQHYNAFVTLEMENPQIRLGGVTSGWLAAVCDAEPELMGQTNRISTPLMIVQAGADSVVSNDAQDAFCKERNAHNETVCVGGKPVVVPGAYHEILFETPEKRQLGLTAITDFFNQELRSPVRPQEPQGGGMTDEYGKSGSVPVDQTDMAEPMPH